ncbi:GlsB/YeaQ/YmgE family stress response membrane protein [Bdellovibrio bacteriovorus]|uniref:Putative transglycosylase-associated protein n=1 Tax=Bdellovibrio bacteriovorus str. Tiberius TaxID=1069642 RepID=K7ZAN5_BDEBC|nr:GlsB/YeaQ/YmgE family stress response membrane protein [Bdellovibrio bacteriovorus]AFY01794.1 putative transglycosylase-associated protein [Bdellovibrio bacteriovorus str. Tiberius]
MIVAIILGLLVGAIAKILMPGRDPGGWIITCMLGIAGSFVAHFIGTRAGYYAPYEPAGFIASVFGSMLILFVYRLLVGKTSHS